MIRIETRFGVIEVNAPTNDEIPLNDYAYSLIARLLLENHLKPKKRLDGIKPPANQGFEEGRE